MGNRAGSNPVIRTRLSLDAIRVPGSAFYFVSSLAFMVGYLFVNASQGVGDEIVVTQIVLVFIWVSGLFRGDFSKSPHRGCPTPKRAKSRFPNKNRKAVLSFFRHRQGNNFRWPVRDVLGIDRGRRRWGSTCSRDGRND